VEDEEDGLGLLCADSGLDVLLMLAEQLRMKLDIARLLLHISIMTAPLMKVNFSTQQPTYLVYSVDVSKTWRCLLGPE
jgi:hypothetical protein